MWKVLKSFLNTKLLFILFLGLIIRFLLIPQPGFVADVSFWKSWALSALDKGALWTFENTNYNYAPTFIYFLKALAFVYRLFADPNKFYEYWQVHNFFFLLILKIPLILADTLTALCIFYLVRQVKISQKKPFLPLLASAFYYLNPAIIFNGIYWGQVGTLGAALTSLILILTLNKKPKLVHLVLIGLLIPVTVLIKLQYVIFMPFILLILFLNHGHKKTVITLASACVSFFLINLPFFLVHKLSVAINLVFISASWFPFLSLNAYNLWWLASRGAGFTTHDQYPFFGLGAAKSTGLLLFAVVFLTAVLLILKKPTRKNLILSCILTSYGFFMFPTEMHERYLYPIFLFLALSFPYFSIRKQPREKSSGNRWVARAAIWLRGVTRAGGPPASARSGARTSAGGKRGAGPVAVIPHLTFCSAISILAFYNLHNVLYQNYPQNSLPLLNKLDIQNLTLVVSLLNLIFFLVFLSFVLKRLKKLTLIPIFTLILLLSFKYYQNNKKSISLTKIPLIHASQGYGSLGKNLSVSSSFSPKNQSFLSTNYFFYRQGLGSHAPSHLVFPLQDRYRRLVTDIGVDTQAGSKASVVFQVWGEGKLLYDSGLVKKQDFPKRIDISIEGVKNLDLIVTDADDGKTDDHANWLNPIIYK